MNRTNTAYLERARKCYELKELERLGLTPTLDQRELILKYIALLLKWNSAAGLISPGDEEHLFLRHFCDSLQPLLLFGFKKNAKILDIGAGGGFPSIPIRIFRPDLTFILAESNKKKSMFLMQAKTDLGFTNMEIYSGNVEKLPASERSFDYIISRGLGTMQKFSQLARPFLASDGHMYTFKTKQFAQELDKITSSKDKEGIKISEIAEYDLGNQIFGLNLVSLEITK
jgi:16S rRNA (guanine527-N7)-methyltransferase